jgi:hypothetical protein
MNDTSAPITGLLAVLVDDLIERIAVATGPMNSADHHVLGLALAKVVARHLERVSHSVVAGLAAPPERLRQ